MSYESDLARLEAIVGELQRDDLELDQALTLFEEGVECLRTAQAALTEVEGKVRMLVERADGSYSLGELGG
ncbi:MAG: exodeoxyribonuclease VII small subunit [Gemmatimonadaceae bacterium]